MKSESSIVSETYRGAISDQYELMTGGRDSLWQINNHIRSLYKINPI